MGNSQAEKGFGHLMPTLFDFCAVSDTHPHTQTYTCMHVHYSTQLWTLRLQQMKSFEHIAYENTAFSFALVDNIKRSFLCEQPNILKHKKKNLRKICYVTKIGRDTFLNVSINI